MSDDQQRLEAVQPQRSVIVQAPAGSGKTTLLVERYLGLLAVVEAPEEILAITFTRKAAAEMRQRVLQYLDPLYESDAPHEQAPLAKARAVRDKVVLWQLLENPQRLMIRTIDSFNHFLARSMPIASQLGPVPAPADNTQALYRQAARKVLALLDSNHPIKEDLARLLDWKDHRSQDVEELIATMLGKRDQWLRALRITGLPQRERLEAVLHELVAAQLDRISRRLDEVLAATGTSAEGLASLLQFAGETLIKANASSPITVFANEPYLPDADPESLPRWSGLAEVFLTQKGKYRAKGGVTKKIGFNAKLPEKDAFQEILVNFDQFKFLEPELDAARSLPDPHYSDDAWPVLESLVQVLLRAAAELDLVFAANNQTDYAGLAAAALRGLGNEDTGITDLGLYLDRRIQHILVDEFQDTNWGQLNLIEKLTDGWEPDDGRSLFVVGDPMQSIYRFREAEVGLFIRSRNQGIGSVALESKQLTRNFRSKAEVVDWVNNQLGPIFPEEENIAAGAVAYAPSEAGQPEGGQVNLHAYATPKDEAEAIVGHLQQALEAQRDNPGYKAAIIVRARSHLAEIAPLLTERGIPFRAMKLDPLLSQPVVQDLLAITRAIVQPADVTALLAVLRSPVCGLTLEELTTLAGDGASLFATDALQRLSAAAQQRAQPVLAALADADAQWQQRNLRDQVEGTWHRLGGPACCPDPQRDQQSATAYLDALEQAEADGLLKDWNDFLERLQDAKTEGDPASEEVKLEVLTMHSAKGLEWDLVVLPGLQRAPPPDGTPLLYWLPFTTDSGAEDILLAPLRSSDENKNSALVDLIKNEQSKRTAYENQRLLYVATTRAKHQLMLTACIDPEATEFKPHKGSLLADLWLTCGAHFLTSSAHNSIDNPDANNTADSTPRAISEPALDQALRRVAEGWQPAAAERYEWQAVLPTKEPDFDIEYNWAGLNARRNGTVLHRLLERVGNLGIENLTTVGREQLNKKIPHLLRAMGIQNADIAAPTQIIQDALDATLDSKEGQRLLSNEHSEAACELAISGFIDGELVNAIIDRTFIDADGVRWVIDYKSGYHDGGDLPGFFREEGKRYAGQLARYKRLFEQLEDRKVVTALYLPRHNHLEVVD